MTKFLALFLLAFLLVSAVAPAPVLADSETTDAVMSRLTNENLAREFQRLTPSMQKAVKGRLTVAKVIGSIETAPKRGLAAPLAYGCWTRTYGVRGVNSIGQPLWAHFSTMNWCEDGTNMTSGNGYAYGQTYQIGWFYRGTNGWTSEGGPGFSYYGDFRQSTFELCIIYCVQASYPWTNNHALDRDGRFYAWTDSGS